MLKEAILKGLCPMWFYFSGLLKKTKLQRQKKDQWLPEARVGGGATKAQHGEVCCAAGWGEDGTIVPYLGCGGGYTKLNMC